MAPKLLFLSLSMMSIAYAQVAKYCSSDVSDLCYQVNIPDRTAQTGDGDIYLQIKGPSSLSWMAIGTGSGMSGSNMFVVYTDSDGTNVTVSPRLGQGHFEPEFNPDASVALLAGSGVNGDVLTANIRCSGCAGSSDSQIGATSTASDWIWAAHEGSALNSNSESAEIEEHTYKGNFQLDLTQATGGSSLNPFTGAAAVEGSSSSSGSSDSDSDSDSDSNSGGSSNAVVSSDSDSAASGKLIDDVTMAHGIIMSLAFVIFFPAGAILIRLLSFRGAVWVHASMQIWAYVLAIAGLGMGVWVARSSDELNEAHPIIGIVVVALLILQPPLGLIHHRLWKTSERRTAWAHIHLWLGRALITLGIINGGLGLQLAANTRSGEIAYGVVAAVVFLIWMVVVVFKEVKGNKNGSLTEKRSTGSGSDRGFQNNGGRRVS